MTLLVKKTFEVHCPDEWDDAKIQEHIEKIEERVVLGLNATSEVVIDHDNELVVTIKE